MLRMSRDNRGDSIAIHAYACIHERVVLVEHWWFRGGAVSHEQRRHLIVTTRDRLLVERARRSLPDRPRRRVRTRAMLEHPRRERDQVAVHRRIEHEACTLQTPILVPERGRSRHVEHGPGGIVPVCPVTTPYGVRVHELEQPDDLVVEQM